MVHDVIATCPVCSGELTITRLHCRTCGTALEGEFGVGRFGRLSREQLALLESFLRARGNLKEMERELGISYPTVRSRVDALVRALGLGDGRAAEADEIELGDAALDEAEMELGEAALDAELAARDGVRADVPSRADVAAARRDVLERLARKELSAEDAAAELRQLGAA
jgi:hypothetical protein